jgi:2-haloacid dehalogenase
LPAFKALTFDCYGTLIDWESGIISALGAWAEGHGLQPPNEALLSTFARAESTLEARMPTAAYRDILRRVHAEIAQAWGVEPEPTEADAFAASIADWPPFPDSTAALQVLAQRYRLVVVSNVDRDAFAHSERRLGVEFDAVVTAEEVGAYKPDRRMFERAFQVLADLGVARSEILHVAQSLYHDHVPAKALGLATVWVNRRLGQEGWGPTVAPEAPVNPDLVVASLQELAALVEEAH